MPHLLSPSRRASRLAFPVLVLAVVAAHAGRARAEEARLYWNGNFSGNSTPVNADRPTLPGGLLPFDNMTSSIRVINGPIAVYAGPNYTGTCATIGADVPALAVLGIDNTISSVRVAWTCEAGAFDADACAAAPCPSGELCNDLPRPAPASADGRTCSLPATAPNLALGRPTRQSSTGYGGLAARATDGNRDGVFNAGSVTSTTTAANTWLEIDLGVAQPIASVTVHNRTDCCAERLASAVVELATDRCDAATRTIVATSTPLDASPVQTRAPPAGTLARYVCIRQPRTTILSVAEVTVEPTAVAPPPTDPPPAAPAGVWTASPWSLCSADVNGTRTRDWACLASDGAALADPACASSRPPRQSEPCNAFAWRPATWGACSASCGVGTRERAVICADETGRVGPALRCDGAPPPTSEACDAGPCVRWEQGAWSACSADVNGSQSRPTSCVDVRTGLAVTDAACASLGSRPAGQTRACHVFAWRAEAWSACSATCGGGTRTRAVTCADETGRVGASLQCGGSPPATGEACDAGPCVHWELGPWRACSAAVDGTQSRSVTCFDVVAGATIADAACATQGSRPAAQTRSCNVYTWLPGPWGACSAPCGGGTRRRVVTCADASGVAGPSTACSGSPPTELQACNPAACDSP